MLPAGILEYLELTNTTRDSKEINIFPEEKNAVPEDYKDQLLHFKGLLPENTSTGLPYSRL